MLKKSTILAAAAFGLMGVGASAVQAAPAPENKWELTLAGIGTNDTDFDTTAFSVQGTLGYYLDEASQHQVNVRQGIIYSDLAGSALSGSTAVGYDYHFDMGQDQRIIPFVGLAVGYNYGDTNDTFFAGPEAGVKFDVNDTTFIYGQVAYQFFFEDTDDADDAIEDGSWNYSLGIGFRF